MEMRLSSLVYTRAYMLIYNIYIHVEYMYLHTK